MYKLSTKHVRSFLDTLSDRISLRKTLMAQELAQKAPKTAGLGLPNCPMRPSCCPGVSPSHSAVLHPAKRV